MKHLLCYHFGFVWKQSNNLTFTAMTLFKGFITSRETIIIIKDIYN